MARPKRRRSPRTGQLLTVLATTCAVAVLLVLYWPTPATKPTAVILDPISTSLGDKNFTKRCTALLEAAGYTVEAYEGGEVTVERVKSIRGCYLLVLRVHSSVFDEGVWFFTGEPYSSTEHVPEQLSNDLHIGRTSLMENLTFAVGASFITRNLRDRLPGALVVLMGCDGLRRANLAEAFTEAGAAAYVSWDGPITIEQTDEATLGLLNSLVTERLTLRESVDSAPLGSEGGFNTTLTIYPADGGGFRLPP